MLTPGDRILLYFAHQGLRDGAESLGAADLRRRQPFVRHGLCRLAYPEDYTAAPADVEPNFAPWTSGVGAAMLEALQPELEARWIEVEGGKSRIAEWQRMRDLGRSQERVLTAFLDAVEQAGRLDLARFLLRAAHHLLGEHAERRHVGGRPDERRAAPGRPGRHLPERPGVAAADAAVAIVGPSGASRRLFRRGLPGGPALEGRLGAVQGDVLHDRAAVIVRQLDPLRQA